jgi:uncharacterized membrane protein
MTALVAAACLFVGIHLGISGTKLRDVITGAIGENPYRGLFAITSLGAVVWMCIAYNQASISPANTVLFDAGQGFRNFGIVIVGFALLLALPGVMRGNPTSAGQDKAQVGGMLRITRHPFLIGATLWSGFHLIGSGSLAATILFATFFIVATLGMPAIDAKVRRKRPEDWKKISAQTSIIPFAAIIAGRNRFVAREIFDWRFGVAIVVVLVLLYFHNALFGPSPFPNGWLPG